MTMFGSETDFAGALIPDLRYMISMSTKVLPTWYARGYQVVFRKASAAQSVRLRVFSISDYDILSISQSLYYVVVGQMGAREAGLSTGVGSS